MAERKSQADPHVTFSITRFKLVTPAAVFVSIDPHPPLTPEYRRGMYIPHTPCMKVTHTVMYLITPYTVSHAHLIQYGKMTGSLKQVRNNISSVEPD